MLHQDTLKILGPLGHLDLPLQKPGHQRHLYTFSGGGESRFN